MGVVVGLEGEEDEGVGLEGDEDWVDDALGGLLAVKAYCWREVWKDGGLAVGLASAWGMVGRLRGWDIEVL